MADKNPITTWLFSNKAVFNPSFTEFEWPARHFPGISDFSTEIRLENLSVLGRGLDVDPFIALEKSAAEALERLIWKRLNLSFHGFAVSGAKDSKSHAEFEAIERYFLHTHLSRQIQFSKISSDHAIKKIEIHFAQYNPKEKVEFYKMAAPSELQGIVCQIQSSDDHSFLGFALARESDTSISKAFFEAVTNYAWMKYKIHSDENHQLPWHMTKSFIRKVQALFSSDDVAERMEIPKLIFSTVSVTSIPELNECPISPVGCSVEGLGPFAW